MHKITKGTILSDRSQVDTYVGVFRTSKDVFLQRGISNISNYPYAKTSAELMEWVLVVIRRSDSEQE